MRLYECKLCGSQNTDAYSAVDCCVFDMKKQSFTTKEKLTPGDIIVLLKQPFYSDDYNGQWLYMSITNDNSPKQLYPYFIVISLSYNSEKNIKRYYLKSDIFEKNKTFTIDSDCQFLRLSPDCAFFSNAVRIASKEFRKEMKNENTTI